MCQRYRAGLHPLPLDTPQPLEDAGGWLARDTAQRFAEYAAADLAAAGTLGELINWLSADPVLLGRYPDGMVRHLPAGFAADLPVIAEPLDFYGVNYYEPQGVAAPSPGNPLPPVYITENGCSGADQVDAAGRVADAHRIDYLAGHLAALGEAMAAGVDVRGYFVWSLLDNFEWSKGYRPRFGLVHVDYSTQVRTPKDSYRWYQSLIRGRS